LTIDGDHASALDEFFGLLIPGARSEGSERAPAGEVRWFVFSDIVVEIEIDVAEEVAFTLVSMPVDGHRPTGYYVDDAGRPVRWHLAEILRDAGLRDEAEALRRLTRKTGGDAVVRQVKTSIEALIRHRSTVVRQLRTKG
jgi:hypothetical protein